MACYFSVVRLCALQQVGELLPGLSRRRWHYLPPTADVPTAEVCVVLVKIGDAMALAFVLPAQ